MDGWKSRSTPRDPASLTSSSMIAAAAVAAATATAAPTNY